MSKEPTAGNRLMIWARIGLALLSLLVLSAPAENAANPRLRAGLAKIDITPSKPVSLGGYALRTRPSEGVFAPIYTRALAFDDGNQKAILIESDIVDYRDREGLRKRIAEAVGLPLSNVLLAAVHNHSGPYPSSSPSDQEWEKEFSEKLIRAAQKALDGLEPVRLGGTLGNSRIGMNRRKRVGASYSESTFDENYFSQSYGKAKTDNPVKIREIEGVVRLGSNFEGPIDDQVGILRIDSLSGKPLGFFVNYACHGTSLGGRSNVVSPEWMGHMLELVEKEMPGVIGIFAAGAGGDINPRFVGGLEGYKDSPENTRKLGYEIGREVLSRLKNTSTAEPTDPRIQLVSEDLLLPRNYRELPDDFTKTTVAVPVSVLRIDDFIWVTLPVELFHEIGKRIKILSHSRYPFVVTYCNGDLGYLPTEKAFSEGGYEPAWSHFDPLSEHVLVRGITALFRRLEK